jgi:hypothetical protein
MNEVHDCYYGSNGDRTKALYDRLKAIGPAGVVAVNLLRASKNSERAKQYKSGRSVRAAYGSKDWALGELLGALNGHGADLGFVWGWGRDEKAVNFEDVLYIDIPGVGQVSHHLSYRGSGPDYPGQWDGAKGTGPERVIKFATAVLTGEPLNQEEADVKGNGPQGAGAARDAGEQRGDETEKQATFGF